MKELKLYDSLQKKKVIFSPIKENVVKVYVCGPTVYDNSHLGHARSAIVFDLLHRVLLANNYKVIMAKNFTDVDDKILKKMELEQSSLENLTSFYINDYKSDMKKLNVLDNTIEPKATENINEMVDMVSNLINKGFAYNTSDGIYFNTHKIENKINVENVISRIENNPEKINQSDFALWKFEKGNKFSFNTSIGVGRPGWHIECSAMIKKHLAYLDEPYQIDIHGGGIDLLFPHHENESTQTKYESGQELSKYWMHNGFITINGEKMSKSLGNSFFLKDIFKFYHGEVIRFYLLNSHYRSNLDFNEIDLIASKKRLDKIFRVKRELIDTVASFPNKKFIDDLLSILNNDLNTLEAFVLIEEMISITKNKSELLANLNYVSEILGIGLSNPIEYFQYGVSNIEEIEKLILERNLAKLDRNFEKSDSIREYLLNIGISILDTKNGVIWEKSN